MLCSLDETETARIQPAEMERKFSVMVQQSCKLHGLSDGDGSRAVDIYVSCWFRIKGGIACWRDGQSKA